MRRRQLLMTAATLALPALPLPRVLARAASRSPADRVRPSDPAWPSVTAWESLGREVNGNLLKVAPLLGACAGGRDTKECKGTLKNLANPFYLGDQPAGTQLSGWVGAWQAAPSVYAVPARSTADVSAAVNFARRNKLRLVVKGGGHSYQGTSNARDSLLIWTRAMTGITLHEDFVPAGARGRVEPQAAVTIDAGAMWIDAYDAVTTRAGRYVQGGGCTTVGVPGLVQSGGFGSFSKGFGTAAGGLLQAEIVTADGMVRTVNADADPELFWALKGGGGGSWGVVTKVTLRTYPLPQFFGGAEGTIAARSDEGYRRLIRQFVDFYAERLLNPHWGEHVRLGPRNTLELSLNCQGVSPGEVQALWNPFFDRIRADGQLRVTDELWAGAGPARHWWDAVYRQSRGSHSMISDPRPGAPATHAWWSGDREQVGAMLYAYQSAWLPASLLQPSERGRLADALYASSRCHGVELHFNKGLAGAPPDVLAAAADTATNPEVLRAFALAIIADGGPPAFARPAGRSSDISEARGKARAVAQAMSQLRRVAPGAGSYVSESNFFEADWQRSYWGNHYPRLRLVKRKYDPDGLFFVHHGVGSEDWSADGFTRLR